jgi:tetratricopeptide (TPR) repeat protein
MGVNASFGNIDANYSDIDISVSVTEKKDAQSPRGSKGSENKLITNLPDRNPHFSGRETKLEDIAKHLAENGKLVVKGTGGYGKTELAVEYAYLHLRDFDYIWLANAQSEVTLENDYKKFLLRTGVEETVLNEPGVVVGKVIEWLQNNDSYLFIIDNAEYMAKTLKDYLPEGQLRGQILINTRHNLDLPYKDKPIDLNVFSLPESIAFLTSCNSCTEEDAQKLADLLGNLPLALGHAAAYMEHTKRSCAEYIKLLQKNDFKLLSKGVGMSEREKTVATTWKISIEMIESESAKQLFNLCAYFAPEDIPLEMLINGREELPQPLRDTLEDELSHDDLVLELAKYSLLTFKRESGQYLLSMHRLMQKVVRASHAEDTQWVSYCLSMARSVFKYSHGDKTFVRNVAHVLAIAKYAEEILKDDDYAQKIAAWLYNEAGLGFGDGGIYTQALDWFYKVLIIYEKVYDKEHQNTATAYNNIAKVYKDLGDYDKALEWYHKDLAICEKVLGAQDPHIATTYNNIAMVYNNQGDFDRALERHNKALEIREKHLEHTHTAHSYNNIAAVYDSLGDYQKALEWYNKALTIKEKALGTQDPDTAITYHNIAGTYAELQDYDKALELFQKSYAIRYDKLGENHPNTKSTKEYMEITYNRAGYEKPFEEWFNETFAAVV